MDIKEIALNVADSLRNKIDGISHMQSNQGLVAFAEALIAELAKYSDEPVVAYRHLMEDGWEYFDAPTGDDCPKCVPLIVKPGTKLYTVPPTAGQIANETAWRDIETAPKDGATRVLLCIDHGEWGDKVWTGLWADGWMVSYGKARTEPTHWMPLPTPPSEGGK